MNSENSQDKNKGLNLLDLIIILWNRKILITTLTSFAAIFSVLYALSLPNIYTSQAILSPSGSDDSLSSKLGAFSGLAGLAGVSIPGDSGDKTSEAMARIRSYDFFVNEFLPYIKLENLMATKKWDFKTNTLIYNEKDFDEKNSRWVRKVKFPRKPKPSNQEAYKVYGEILVVSQDLKTSFVTISIDHKSPHIAKEWLNLIIKNINEHMRQLDKTIAANSVEYLNSTAQSTNISQIKTVISKLLEDQMQDLMLAEATADYVFTPIASPIAPERKSKPVRAVICILITMLGFMISIMISIGLHFYPLKK